MFISAISLARLALITGALGVLIGPSAAQASHRPREDPNLQALAAKAYAQQTGFRPSCKAVTEPAERSESKLRPSATYNVMFRVRCNFRVTQLSLRSSKSLVRVLKRPALERPDPEDTLDCTRRSRALGRCTGEVGEQVRIQGAFKVKGDPCCDEKLSLRVHAVGGQDCDPPATACPNIGYGARVLVKRPRGCPRRASRLGRQR